MVSFKSLSKVKVVNLRNMQECRRLTNDPNILSITSGDKIEFVDTPRIQHKYGSPKFLDEEINLIR